MQFINDSQLSHVGDADAAATAVFFNQQLTHIVARMFEVKHRGIEFRETFNINNEGGAGITAIMMYIWDMSGAAKFISNYADDLPSAGAGAKQVTVPVRWIGDSFHVSWMELQQAAQANVRLNDMRANAANRAIEYKLNGVAYGTDDEATELGIYGLLNNPNVPESPVIDGISGNTEWSSKTPDEILLDINNAFTSIQQSTRGAHIADRIDMPIEQFNYLVNTRLSDLSDKNILTWLVENSPYLSGTDAIRARYELQGAGPAGEDAFVVWQSDDEIAEFYIPYEKNPPVGTLVDGLAYKTPIVASTAGLEVRYPLAFVKGTGI